MDRVGMDQVSNFKAKDSKDSIDSKDPHNPSNFEIYQISHRKQNYYTPFEEFSQEESDLILKDLLDSQQVGGKFKLLSCDISPMKSYLGHEIIDKIDKFKAKRFNMKIKAMMDLPKKNKYMYKEDLTYEEYFNVS